MLDLADFAVQEQPADNLMVAISRPWYNGSYTRAVKPIKSLELHYTMIQFLIIVFIQVWESWSSAFRGREYHGTQEFSASGWEGGPFQLPLRTSEVRMLRAIYYDLTGHIHHRTNISRVPCAFARNSTVRTMFSSVVNSIRFRKL